MEGSSSFKTDGFKHKNEDHQILIHLNAQEIDFGLKNDDDDKLEKVKTTQLIFKAFYE